MAKTSQGTAADGRAEGDSGVERLNVALTPDAARAMDKLQARTGRQKVNLVNTALPVLEYLDKAIRQGATIILEDPDGQTTVVKIFY